MDLTQRGTARQVKDGFQRQGLKASKEFLSEIEVLTESDMRQMNKNLSYGGFLGLTVNYLLLDSNCGST